MGGGKPSQLSSGIKIALVRILWDDRYEVNTASRNVGLLYLQQAVQQHWGTATIFHELSMEDAIAVLQQEQFDAIGFTVHVMNIQESLQICKEIKKILPHVYTALWGHHASWSADKLLGLDYIDSVFIWEWEVTINEWIQDIKKEWKPKDKYIPTQYPQLDTLSYPMRDTVHSVERIVTSRWCPYSCTFCTTPMLRTLAKEPTYRERSAKNVVDEIEYLVNNWARRIIFNDDLFCINSTKSHTRAMEIADEIIKRWIKVSYKVQLRVDSITNTDTHLLEKLYESWLREVFLWIESGSDKTLETFWKKTTKTSNFAAIKLYETYGIKVNAGNILATADSTIEDICESINAFNDVDLAYLLFRRVTTKAVVFPWTQLETDLFNNGFIDSQWDFLINSYTFSNPKVGKIIWYLEKYLPNFLHEVWEKIFPLRNKALVIHYANTQTEIPTILAEWSNLTADFLLHWFQKIPDEEINEEQFSVDFENYISASQIIYERLFKLVNTVPFPDFYADTF